MSEVLLLQLLGDEPVAVELVVAVPEKLSEAVRMIDIVMIDRERSREIDDVALTIADNVLLELADVRNVGLRVAVEVVVEERDDECVIVRDGFVCETLCCTVPLAVNDTDLESEASAETVLWLLVSLDDLD